MTRPWRNCNASLRLLDAVNALWPGRDKASDGTIGDAAHASRDSDHNPWIIDPQGIGVVRARDIDSDGIPADQVAETLRQMAAAGDTRLTGGGYVIFNRRITKPDWSGWAVYTGVDPHTGHIHVSFSRNAAGYDSNAPWDLGGDDGMAGEGTNIVRMLTGANAPSMDQIRFDEATGRVVLPPGLEPDGLIGRIVDIQWAFTKKIPALQGQVDAASTAIAQLSEALTSVAAAVAKVQETLDSQTSDRA